MDTIRMYLDNMFFKLPRTEEVLKAKQELLSMMEDKYYELIKEGKTENEAVGIVIAEFGNLEELAKELGITDTVNHVAEYQKGRFVDWEEAGGFMKASGKSAFGIALGVMLCIWSPMLIVMNDELSHWVFGAKFREAASMAFLFLLIAIAVGLFIYSGMLMERFSYLQKNGFYLDYETMQYLTEQKSGFKTVYKLSTILGVILCILSPLPLVIIDKWLPHSGFFNGVCVAGLLFLVGIAVFLFVSGGIRLGAYQTLLKDVED